MTVLLPPGVRLEVDGLYLRAHDAWGCTVVEWPRPHAWLELLGSCWERAGALGQGQPAAEEPGAPVEEPLRILRGGR